MNFNSMEENIDLSIVMITYNHEKYIKQAIQSVFAQKMTFRYELLIGEDCSTDATRQIIEETIKGHEEVRFFPRSSNMGMIANTLDLFSKVRGKYIAYLEGDDYYTDPLKLQKQVTFLQEHPAYSGVYTDCSIVDENGVESGDGYWCPKEPEYTLKKYVNFELPGQTCTLVARNDLALLNMEMFSDIRNCPGDRLIPLFLLDKGKIGFINEKMSAYRHITTSESWSSKQEWSAEQKYVRAAMGSLEAEAFGSRLGIHFSLEFVRMFMAAMAFVTGVRYQNREYRQAFGKIWKITGHKILFLFGQLYFIPRTVIQHKKFITRVKSDKECKGFT